MVRATTVRRPTQHSSRTEQASQIFLPKAAEKSDIPKTVPSMRSSGTCPPSFVRARAQARLLASFRGVAGL